MEHETWEDIPAHFSLQQCHCENHKLVQYYKNKKSGIADKLN